MSLHSGQAKAQGLSCVPPTPGCDTAIHNGTDYNVEVSTTISDITIKTTKGSWETQEPCNTFWALCDSPLFRECFPQPAVFGRSEETCWSVSGSVSVEGKTGLLTKLFAELGVSVTIGGSFTSCVTLSSMHTIIPPVSDCFTNHARGVWDIHKVTGTLVEDAAVSYWTCYLPSGAIVPAQTHCGRSTSTGFADTYGQVTRQYTNHTPECGGPNPPNPDPHDGMTNEKCCSPMSGCDEVIPPAEPCCGCWAPS